MLCILLLLGKCAPRTSIIAGQWKYNKTHLGGLIEVKNS